MISQTRNPNQTRSAWSQYWELDGAHEQRAVGGPRYRATFEQFWRDQLEPEFASRSSLRVLDAACGDGAVTRHCAAIWQGHQDCALDLHATDCAERALAAIDALSLPGGPGLVVADAKSLPYAQGAFDCVLSQCGLEYAGLSAFETAAGLVAPGGCLMALVHHDEGLIHQECGGHHDLLSAIADSAVFEHGKALFDLQRLGDSGEIAPEAVADAAAEVGRELAGLLAGLDAYPRDGARQHAERLLQDFSALCARHTAYAPDQACQWLEFHQGALMAFRLRMQSMLTAGQGEAEMGQLEAVLADAGLGQIETGILEAADTGQPLAWSLRACAA
mgnify:CR=1 FL=1|tara:strand:- start:1646 stop:2641 length:996 start_codon:yes stop_codon:yes gene_type:complete